jgi:DNA-binding LacI/PurR family transcriptional regulator
MSTPQVKKHTIEDVASAMGISIATVSRAFTGNGRISPKTREAVLETARQMGFSANPFAQRLAGGSVERVVPICSLYLDLGISTLKLQAIQNGFRERHIDAPLHAYGNFDPYHPVGQTTMIEKLRRQQPPAIVVHPSGLTQATFDELRCYQKEGGIVVSYDEPCDLDCDKVLYDWKESYVQTLQHLKALGHTAIGWYHPGPTGHVAQIDESCRALGEAEGSDSWLPHFQAAMEECELPLNMNWLWSGSGGEPAGAELAEIFVGLKERPTALCILNDNAVAGFIGRLWQLGLRVPEDVSVVGHDDLPMAAWFPVPITTVTGEVAQIAEAVVDLIMSRLDGKYQGPSREVILKGTVLQRQTTKAL